MAGKRGSYNQIKQTFELSIIVKKDTISQLTVHLIPLYIETFSDGKQLIRICRVDGVSCVVNANLPRLIFGIHYN